MLASSNINGPTNSSGNQSSVDPTVPEASTSELHSQQQQQNHRHQQEEQDTCQQSPISEASTTNLKLQTDQQAAMVDIDLLEERIDPIVSSNDSRRENGLGDADEISTSKNDLLLKKLHEGNDDNV